MGQESVCFLFSKKTQILLLDTKLHFCRTLNFQHQQNGVNRCKKHNFAKGALSQGTITPLLPKHQLPAHQHLFLFARGGIQPVTVNSHYQFYTSQTHSNSNFECKLKFVFWQGALQQFDCQHLNFLLQIKMSVGLLRFSQHAMHLVQTILTGLLSRNQNTFRKVNMNKHVARKHA